MTDQNPAVAALAEALRPTGSQDMPLTWEPHIAEKCITFIAANLDILREYGIGRLPTRSELESIMARCVSLAVDDHSESYIEGINDSLDTMVEAGYAVPDPEPVPEPELPTKQDLLHLLNSYESDLQSDRSGLRYRQDILTMFSALYAAAEAGRSQK